MIILVINCGSSSIKYQLLDMKNDDVYSLLAKGIVEKIGLECGRLQHTPVGKEKVVKDLPVPDHTVGMQIVLDALIDKFETGLCGNRPESSDDRIPEIIFRIQSVYGTDSHDKIYH